MEKEWWELARSIIIEDSSDPDDLVEAVKSLERKTKLTKGTLRPIYQNVLVLFKAFLDCGKLLKQGSVKARSDILSKSLLKKVNIYYKQLIKKNLVKEANTLILIFNFKRASIGFDKGYFAPKKHPKENNIDILYKEYNGIFDLFLNIVVDVIDTKEIQFLRYFWENFTNVLSTLRDSFLELNDRFNAIEIYNSALKFLNSLDKKIVEEWKQEKIMDIYMRIGDLFFQKLDEFNEAEKYYKIAAKLNEKINSDKYYLFLKEREAGLALQKGNESKALEILNDVSRFTKEIDIDDLQFNYLEINTFQNLAIMYNKMDKYNEADSFFKIALTRIDKFDDNIPMRALQKANCRIAYSYNLLSNGAIPKAIILVKKAYEIVKNLNLKSPNKYDYQLVDVIGLLFHLLRYSNEEESLDVYHQELEEIIRRQKVSETLPPGKYINALNFNATYYINKGMLNKSLENAEMALLFFKSLPDSMKNNSTFQDILADILSNFGITYSNLNQNRKAINYYIKCLEIYEPLLSEKSQYYNQFTGTLHSLAKLYHRIGDINSAKMLFIFCEEIRSLLYETNNDAYSQTYGNTLNDKGLLHLLLGEIKEAEEDLTKAYIIYENINEKFNLMMDENNLSFEKGITAYSNAIAMISDNLGKLYENMKISKTSEDYYRQAINIRRKLQRMKPLHFTLSYANSLNNLAVLKFEINDLIEAEKLWLNALKIIKESSNKQILVNRVFLAKLYNNIFRLYLRKEDYKKALKSLEDAYLLIKDNHNDLEAVVEKTTTLLYYENLIIKSSSIRSEIIKIIPLEKTPSIKRLISIDEHFTKIKVENLYLSLLKNEVSKLLKKKNCKWSDLEKTLEIIQSLRSSKSVINQEEQFQIKKVTKELDLDLNENIVRLKNLKQKRREIKENISNIESKKFQFTKESFYSQKSSLLRQDLRYKEEANQLFTEIKKLSSFEIPTFHLVLDLLETYFRIHPNYSFLILQHVLDQIIFIYLSKKDKIVKSISAKSFLDISKKLFDQINNISEGKDNKISKDILISSGKELFQQIPFGIRNKLFKNNSIQISLCGITKDIPIEYLHNEKNFLGLNSVITKIFSLKHYLVEVNSLNKRKLDSKTALIITDPTTDRYEKLNYAIEESNTLINNLRKSNFDITQLLREKAKLSNIEPILDKGISLLHFSGHGEEDGLVLFYDEKLDTNFLRERFVWFENRPIIFLNCCLTGITFYHGGGKFEGLIPNLHRINSGPIIASNKKIFDESSKIFSLVFYDNLLNGRKVGEAFLNAQKQIKDTMLWGTYQLFGYPDYSL